MDYLRKTYGLDIRSLALFRIVMGVHLLLDIGARCIDLEAFFTDFGILPRARLIENFSGPWLLSFHLWGGTALSQIILFAIEAVAVMCFLVGYRTRLATFVCWVLLCSSQGRNPMVLQAGDILMRLMLFWSLFVPLGACWSVDRARQDPNDPTPPQQVFSLGTLAMMVQPASVYLFTWLLKGGDEWRDGSAVYFALSIDQFATDFAHFLLDRPILTIILTHATFWLELLGPILLFVPIWNGPIRTLTTLALLGMHIGFGMGLKIGLFMLTSCTAVLFYLPTWFWDQLDRFAKRPIGEMMRFFASTRERVRRWTDRLSKRPLRWRTPVWAQALVGALMCYCIAWNIGTLEFFTYLSLNRKNPSDFAHPIEISHGPLFKMIEPMESFGYTIRLDQRWNMFAPFPLKEDGWYVFPAKLRDGTEVDLFLDGAKVDHTKPERIVDVGYYTRQRWRKYVMNLWLQRYKDHRLHFGRYLCRLWNREHPDTKFTNADGTTYTRPSPKQLMTFEMIYWLEITPPFWRPFGPWIDAFTAPDFATNYKPPASLETPVKEIKIWKHVCFDPPKPAVAPTPAATPAPTTAATPPPVTPTPVPQSPAPPVSK